MSIYKVLNSAGKYHDKNSLRDVLSYVLRPCKAFHQFTGGSHVDMNDPASSMDAVAAKYKKEKGVRLRHFVLSFTKHEVDDPKKAEEIGACIIACIGEEYQAVYAVHEDSNEYHLHVVFNTVSYVDGHKYRGSKAEYWDEIYAMRNILYNFGIKKMIPRKK